MIELSREERIFVQVMIVALVASGISSFFIYHELVAGLAIAGLLLGSAGLFATMLWNKDQLWILTLALYSISAGAGPFALRDNRDLLGLEAIVIALLFGTLFLFFRSGKPVGRSPPPL